MSFDVSEFKTIYGLKFANKKNGYVQTQFVTFLNEIRNSSPLFKPEEFKKNVMKIQKNLQNKEVKFSNVEFGLYNAVGQANKLLDLKKISDYMKKNGLPAGVKKFTTRYGKFQVASTLNAYGFKNVKPNQTLSMAEFKINDSTVSIFKNGIIRLSGLYKSNDTPRKLLNFILDSVLKKVYGSSLTVGNLDVNNLVGKFKINYDIKTSILQYLFDKSVNSVYEYGNKIYKVSYDLKPSKTGLVYLKFQENKNDKFNLTIAQNGTVLISSIPKMMDEHIKVTK